MSNKTFEEIFKECIELRRENKAGIEDKITDEELNVIQRRNHVEKMFFFNFIHGRMGSKDNAIAR